MNSLSWNSNTFGNIHFYANVFEHPILLCHPSQSQLLFSGPPSSEESGISALIQSSTASYLRADKQGGYRSEIDCTHNKASL